MPEIAETFSIKVLTRHAKDYPKSADPTWRRCNCRKQLYIYENGRVRYVSARTRSWVKAEELMQQEKDARDPVKIALREIAEREAGKAEEKMVRRIRITDAIDLWMQGLPRKSRARQVHITTVAGKLKNWAEELHLEYLDEITPALLYAWRGSWSKNAARPRDQFGPGTQNIYLCYLRCFFKWAVETEYLDKDPSVAAKRQKYERHQTQPLPDPDRQMEEILRATYRYDADRYRDTPEYGVALRAILLLMRWSGIRLIDALMLKKSAIRRGTLNLVTKKRGKEIKNRPMPKVVLDALDAVPSLPGVRDGYYFWTIACDAENLSVMWAARIKRLNDAYLNLADEDGEPMKFRSHMLRDTFAVELLLKGMPLENVSKLLTHESTNITEMYYAPWVKKRHEKLHADLVAALEQMGATFTPASATPQRVM